MEYTKSQQEARNLVDLIRLYGKAAVEDLNRICRENGLEETLCFSFDYTEQQIEIIQKVWNLWHTTNNFKVGDKVYVVPLHHTLMKNCIRAIVTEVNDDGFGYRLRAFKSDLPGIYMFNMWDKDLEPRINKKQKPTPSKLLIK